MSPVERAMFLQLLEDLLDGYRYRRYTELGEQKYLACRGVPFFSFVEIYLHFFRGCDHDQGPTPPYHPHQEDMPGWNTTFVVAVFYYNATLFHPVIQCDENHENLTLCILETDRVHGPEAEGLEIAPRNAANDRMRER